jgi:hypothetical protein
MKKRKSDGDAIGWLRGAKGIDGAYDKDGKQFMKSFDPKADKVMYGQKAVGMFATADNPRVVKDD